MTFIETANKRKIEFVYQHSPKWTECVSIVLYRDTEEQDFRVKITKEHSGVNAHIEKTEEFNICSLSALHEMFTEMTSALNDYNERRALETKLDNTPL